MQSDIKVEIQVIRFTNFINKHVLQRHCPSRDRYYAKKFACIECEAKATWATIMAGAHKSFLMRQDINRAMVCGFKREREEDLVDTRDAKRCRFIDDEAEKASTDLEEEEYVFSRELFEFDDYNSDFEKDIPRRWSLGSLSVDSES